jgi:MFS family permease
VAIYLVGCFLGALTCLKLGDKFGRIRTMIIGNIVNMCGSIIIVSSFSLGQLIAGRVVLGLGLGAM